MGNVIFLSPNFPTNYWQFCRELKNNGMNVLGIGDCPYDQLSEELRESLCEYYRVDSLEDYEAVYRAAAYFIHRYGSGTPGCAPTFTVPAASSRRMFPGSSTNPG